MEAKTRERQALEDDVLRTTQTQPSCGDGLCGAGCADGDLQAFGLPPLCFDDAERPEFDVIGGAVLAGEAIDG